MNVFLIIVSLFFGMTSCESEAKADEKKSTVETTTTATGEKEIPYVNGVTAKNKGLKKGEVHLLIHYPAKVGMAYLHETEGKNFFKIDSTKIVNGVADFGVDEYESGFYMTSINENENNIAAFIINPDEAKVEIGFKSGRLESSLKSIDSHENKGWAAYYSMEKKFNNIITKYRKDRNKSNQKAKFDVLIKAKDDELHGYRNEMIAQYPGTFLAKVITYKTVRDRGDMGKYWTDIDMTDESLVHTTVITDRVQEFMILFSGAKESGFINCVDIIKSYAEVNPRILEFSLYTMLDGFYKSNKENVCLYIYDNYIVDEDCGAELSDTMKSRAEKVMSLREGKVPPNIVVASSNGKNVDLHNIALQNEYTLLMFWSSWCHKCEQEIPVLKKTYEKYHSKGFEVLGISMDLKKSDWLGAIEANGVSWPNGCEFQQWFSQSARDYKVTKTPTLFLLDKNKKIVLKPKRIFEVNKFLQEHLK